MGSSPDLGKAFQGGTLGSQRRYGSRVLKEEIAS